MNRRSVKKYQKFALPALGFGLGLAILGGIVPSVASASTSINKSISVEDSLWNISEDLGKPIGIVRHWQNNGFSGAKTRDGGYVALTGTNSVSRTDSFGNVLWTFNPSNEEIKGYDNSWKGKKAVEIIQDQGLGFQNVYYVLLAPNETPDKANETADGVQEHKYQSIVADKSKQATIVQIVENIAGFTSNSQWQTSYAVTKSVNISPKSMVDNYPENWKKASGDTSTQSGQKDGVSFFSVTQHASWYDDQSGDSGFVMPWRQYITNLGNMYAYQGKLFMFGGNGTVFNDPEALSIGLFRFDFNSDNIEVTGLPYAFVLSGISWFLTEQPSVDGSTGIYHSQIRPIQYETKVPMGQDKTFSYVPRMAVAGISPNFDLVDGEAPAYLYLAGTITVGQSKKSQSKTVPIDNATPSTSSYVSESNTSASGSTAVITTKNWNDGQRNAKTNGWNVKWDKTSTRSLQPSGENFIVSQSLSSPATSENSIDPLSIFGTPLSMAALMSFDAETSNNPYGYTNLMFNSRYYDISIFSGYQSGEFNWQTKTQPIRADVQNFDNESWKNTDKGEKWQIKTMLGELVWSMQRTLLVPTLAYGHSLKSASGLTQFTDENGINGYGFQLGVAMIGFVEPQFDAKSVVYRNPSLTMLNYDLIGDPRLGGTVNVSGEVDNDNYYWLNYGGTDSYQKQRVISMDSISRPGNNLVFDNWKVEDYAASWEYSNLSKQIHKNQSSSQLKTKSLSQEWKNTETKLKSKVDFSNFKGLSISLNENEKDKTNIGSVWLNDGTTMIRNLNTKSSASSSILLTNKPLLTVFTDDSIKTGSQHGNVHTNINISLSFIYRSSNTSDTDSNKKFDVLIYNDASNIGSVYKNDSSNQFKNYDHSDRDVNLVFPTTTNQAQTSFTGQLSGDKHLVNMTYDNEDSSLEFEVQNAAERNNTLGSGTFTGALSNDLLQKNISDLFDFNVNVPGIGSNQTVLNNKWLPQFFNVKQQPKLDKVENSQNIDAVKLVVTNMDLVTQSMTLTAYAYNQDTGTYAFMPSSNGNGNFASISVAKFTGFKALAAWVLPVAIAVPIVVISLVIGLGLGIGLPMQKNKQMLKLGFELQNKKVDTLTTAVGGVFKKIINQTKTDNLKKAPQMLKAASPKPATPATPKAPGAPATAKPATPTAPKASAAKPTVPIPPTTPSAPAASA